MMSDWTICTTRERRETGGRVDHWCALLVAGLLVAPGCAAFRPLRGVPASHAPFEILGESREGRKTINLSLLVQRPADQYRVEAGDILAVYIPGLLGPRTVIGANLGAEIVGEQPPITPPANTLDPPTLGYPITIRDDHTLVLPQLEPINVYGLTLREVEQAIRDACREQRLLQDKNSQILVSLWRAREYRVMVVRQEATEDMAGSMTQLGSLNPGRSKRGSAHVVRLRAYENDVLHALSASEGTIGTSNGLPGLDAENAIYIIRRNTAQGACPAAQLPPTPVSSSPVWQNIPQATMAQPPAVQPPVPPPPMMPPAEGYDPRIAPRPGDAAPPVVNPVPPAMEAQPYANPALEPAPPVVPSRPYGTPENGMPILPQNYQIIRGQNGRPSPFAWVNDRRGAPIATGHSTAAAPDPFASSRYRASAEPAGFQGSYAPVTPASAIFATGSAQSVVPASAMNHSAAWNPQPPAIPYAAGAPTASIPAPVPAAAPQSAYDEQGLFPQEFGYDDFTIDSPNVIRIPVRILPGQSPNITEEDITLYDGDIIFIESRDTEVFYTGGLLGGGEMMLPRDRDLHATEAVSVAQSRVMGGGGGSTASVGGVSALNGDVSISPSRLIVRRRLCDGRIVPIEVDLYRARLYPEEDILIQPRDLLLLQYTCGEATMAFIERHLLAGSLFGLAAAQVSTGNR